MRKNKGKEQGEKINCKRKEWKNKKYFFFQKLLMSITCSDHFKLLIKVVCVNTIRCLKKWSREMYKVCVTREGEKKSIFSFFLIYNNVHMYNKGTKEYTINRHLRQLEFSFYIQHTPLKQNSPKIWLQVSPSISQTCFVLSP